MTVAMAVLVKRQTDDGLVEVDESIPIGKRYQVDVDSRIVMLLYNTEHKKNHTKEIVDIVAPDGFFAGWMPTELLKIEGH